MSIKPRLDTYRYVGEICRLRAQSAVECRLSGSEISSILAIHAKVVPTDSICADGEVRYNGRVLLNVVYEDGEKRVCRAERGAEFFYKAEGKEVTPSCFAKVAMDADNINWRREGSGVYISVVVGADAIVYGNRQIEYLAGGDDLLCRNSLQTVCRSLCVTGETEGEDEFDADEVGDILLHSERAIVHKVEAGAGTLRIEGELLLHICVLKGENSLCSYERLSPFAMQIPSDEAFGDVTAEARVCVKSAHLSAGVDEEKGKSRILFSYCLSAHCFLHCSEQIKMVDDAFSPCQKIQLKMQNDGGRYLTNAQKCTERVSGVAAVSPLLDEEYFLQAALLPRAEIGVKKGERGMEAEGAVLAEIILCNAEGMHRSASLSLPFIFPIDMQADEVEAECIVCGLNVRRKKGGETEAEATLKICLKGYARKEWSYISQVEEKEEIVPNDSAFSVFIPEKGEGLWETAKRLNCSPEEIEKSNPALQFPIQEGQRIFVYRPLR